MRVGTKSLLFGAHCWAVHPLFVFAAWWKLFGFPWDPRLWVCFFVHDIGYWGKPNMDGPEGEQHVELGARIAHALFDRTVVKRRLVVDSYDAERFFEEGWSYGGYTPDGRVRVLSVEREVRWRDLCLYHSRFYAKRDGKPFSRLCVADKLAVALEPWWLYLPRVVLSGEVHEYMELAKKRTDAGEPRAGKYSTMDLHTADRRRWFASMSAYLREWAYAHRDMRPDTWTPDMP